MSRYYIDCEFDGHNGPLISMALVRNGAADSLMIIICGAQVIDPWVAENVLPVIHNDKAESTAWCVENDVGGCVREFIGADPQPVIIADSPVDIMRFCRAITTAADGQWASTDYERMTFIVENVDCYPTTLKGAVQHNAWWDAMALRHVLQGSGARS